MKITAVKTFLVDGVFRPWIFVKIETSEPGLVGWGDCTDWGADKPIVRTVEHYAERLIGRDPMQVEAIWWDLLGFCSAHRWPAGRHVWHRLSPVGYSRKALGAPVWQLLGGKLRDRLRLYWTHCGSMRSRGHAAELGVNPVETLDDLRALCDEVHQRGFTAIKTNLMDLQGLPEGGLPNWQHSTAGDCPPFVARKAAAIIATLREGLGPDVGIALDVAFMFKLGGAIKLARALEPYDMMVETETLDPQALRTAATRRDAYMYGETFGTHQYRPYLDLHAMDVAMPDLAWNGITVGKKLADLAHAYDVLFAPHNCHSPINTLVSAHVSATVPNFYVQELDVDDAPWRDDIMTHPLEIVDGHLLLNSRPGLGSDLIEEEMAKRPVRDRYPYR